VDRGGKPRIALMTRHHCYPPEALADNNIGVLVTTVGSVFLSHNTPFRWPLNG
jgi:hypothetical protein